MMKRQRVIGGSVIEIPRFLEQPKPQNVFMWMAVLLLLLATGCGGGGSSRNSESNASDSGSSSNSGIAAMPAASFKSVGEQSALTTTENIETASVEVEEDGPDLALGERVFGNKCVECHGEGAEGIADKGAALTGLPMDFDAFEDLLRTGGELGPDHLFGTLDVSANGLIAVHAYLTSLE